ncbi:LysR family transcriptional regulator [Sorangium sp. So ce260]
MLDLNDFFLFVQVVDRGGFTAASRTLRTPKSTLSYRMQQLENNLGVRLLNRTPRDSAESLPPPRTRSEADSPQFTSRKRRSADAWIRC